MTDTLTAVRADPEILLSAISDKKRRSKGGKLYLFIGMAPGVGKTYAMLLAAKEAKRKGTDVVIGVVEGHGRKETEQLIDGLEIIPKKKLLHRDIEFLEMDTDAILARKANVVLVDELAHNNIPGSRHQKRWQDVFELLDNGLDVYSTINIQHFESRKEAIEKIANISISETVPDSVLDRAFQIQLIDLSVPDLLTRLKEGKVYLGEKAGLAAENYFKEEKLTALREMALRIAAERVDTELKTFAIEREAGQAFYATERLMVGVGYSSSDEAIIRATRKLAYNLEAPWIVIHVSIGELATEKQKEFLRKNLDLARNLGAEIITVADTHIVDAIIRVAEQKGISQIIVGRSKKRFFRDVLGSGSIYQQLIEKTNIDICVLGKKSHTITNVFAKIYSIKTHSTFSSFIKAFFSSCMMLAISALLVPFIGYRSVGFLLLLGILLLGQFLPLGSIIFASIVAMIGWNLYFIPPVGTFYINESEDAFLCVSFLMAALALGVLTRRIKYQQQILLNREIRIQVLNLILVDIATATTAHELCETVLKRIADFLKGQCDITLLKKDLSLSSFVYGTHFSNLKNELAVAKWAINNNKAAGRFTNTLSSAEALYIPLKGSFDMMGALAYRSKDQKTLSVEDMDFLFTIAHQIAISLEKQEFRKRALEYDRLVLSKDIQQKLLKLLAHEFKLFSKGQDRSFRISFMIDNFLLSSRLQAGIFPLKKELCLLKEVVESAIKIVEKIFFAKSLCFAIHGDPFSKVNVEKDSFIQALANILLNAAQAGLDKEIRIKYVAHEIIICDQGPGVKSEDLGRIFERFNRLEENLKEGHGLGLSIAKGVIKAHGGKIMAKNQPGAGLMIRITLPGE